LVVKGADGGNSPLRFVHGRDNVTQIFFFFSSSSSSSSGIESVKVLFPGQYRLHESVDTAAACCLSKTQTSACDLVMCEGLAVKTAWIWALLLLQLQPMRHSWTNRPTEFDLFVCQPAPFSFAVDDKVTVCARFFFFFLPISLGRQIGLALH
jgi:hypothetical protein